MIRSVDVHDLGPLQRVQWAPSPRVNVVIGHNASGKTLLLKTLWALVRARETWKLGNDPRSYREVADDIAYWTYQIPKLGQLVRRGQETLRARMDEVDAEGSLTSEWRLGKRAERRLRDVSDPSRPSSDTTSVFVPAKEVLSVATQIKQARLERQFGFDEPTTDLVRLLEREVTRGAPLFGDARKQLEALVRGRLHHADGQWVVRQGNWSVPISVAAEGHKKIAIFDRLILNRTLRKESIVFVDEPEAFLHPEALLQFLRILLRMSQDGVQLFLATHSLVVLNALRLHAESKGEPVSVLSLERDGDHVTQQVHDLRDGMPSNAIVDASIRLYEMEMMGRFDD